MTIDRLNSIDFIIDEWELDLSEYKDFSAREKEEFEDTASRIEETIKLLKELQWYRNQDLILRSEAWEKRPEWLNEDMYDINKSKENKGWNKCNKYWYEIIKQIPKAEPTSSILEQVQKGE